MLAEAWLDSLAARVFSPAQVPARLLPLLAIYDATVGWCEPSHPEWEQLQARRLDWALCEALLPPPARPGETWAWQALRGHLADVVPQPQDEAVARSFSGLFEVWPGHEVWVREIMSGVWLRISEAHLLAQRGKAPLAELWDLHIVATKDSFMLARQPLVYPADLADVVRELGSERLFCRHFSALQARSLRLRWHLAGGRIGYRRLFGEWLEQADRSRQGREKPIGRGQLT